MEQLVEEEEKGQPEESEEIIKPKKNKKLKEKDEKMELKEKIKPKDKVYEEGSWLKDIEPEEEEKKSGEES